MSDNQKYYYLKLKDNFFESDTLILLEAQKDGYLYSNILLKLYLRSLKNEGRLAFNSLIPYNAEMLATLTRHQVGTVEKALAMFEQLGLIEVLDNGVIYMTDIQNFIGKSSSEADRQREYQKRITDEKQKLLEPCKESCKKSNKESCKKSNKESCKKFTPETEIEIEKDIEIEIETETEIDNTLSTDVDGRVRIEYSQIVELFNRICVSLPKAMNLTDTRKQKIKSAYKSLNGDFEGFFRRVEESDFLSGRSGKWDKCCFDWILKPSNLVKIIEGNYDNSGSKTRDQSKPDVSKMTFEELAEYEQNGGTW